MRQVLGFRSWVLGALLSLFAVPSSATTVTGTIVDGVGNPATGRMEISWPSFVSPGGQLVARGSATLTLGSGQFAVNLQPNVGATPSGTYYTVRISGPVVSAVETWVVPDTVTAVDVATVRVAIPPTPSATISVGNIPLLSLVPTGLAPLRCVQTDANGYLGVAPAACGGDATVTSVGLAAPDIFSVSGSPVTSAGTLSLALASQTQNYVWAAPSSANGTPTFRLLVKGDIPALSASQITSGTFGDARITETSVTQHQSALSIGWSQITSIPATFTPSTHASSHAENAVDELFGESLGTACSAGQVLESDGAGGLGCGADNGATDLPGLTDVTITGAATGDFLRYNGTAWTDATISDGDVPDNITVTLAATATALAADPTDCSVGEYANAIDASGNLTCAAIAAYDFNDAANLTTGDIAAARMQTNVSAALDAGLATTNCVLRDGSGAIACSSALTLDGDELQVDASSSTTTNPAFIGYSNWSSGNAARTSYGNSTGIQAAFGNTMQLYGFQSIILRGNTGTSTPPAFQALSDIGVHIVNGMRSRAKSGGVAADFENSSGVDLASIGGSQTALFQDATATTGITSVIVKAGEGQSTTDLMQWQDNAGNVLGSITSDGYGELPAVQLVDPGAKPSCTSDTRGMIWYDAGGAGVADTAEICGKDASDVYAWVAIATF